MDVNITEVIRSAFVYKCRSYTENYQFSKAAEAFHIVLAYLQKNLEQSTDSYHVKHYSDNIEYIRKHLKDCERQKEEADHRNIAKIIALAQPKLYSRNLTPSRLDGSHLEYSLVTRVIHRTPRVEWGDILNHEDLKEELMASVLRPLSKVNLVKTRPPDLGIIVFGPPGNGKSMLIKALATGEPFFLNISSELMTTTFATDALQTLQSIFALAYQKQSCIIGFDQIDKIFRVPSLTHELLTLMENIGFNDRIIVIGETSQVENMSMPVKRKFTKRLLVKGPSFSERVEMIYKNTKGENAFGIRYDEIEKVAELTEHFSYKDLQVLLIEVKNYALKTVLNKIQDTAYIPLATYQTFVDVLNYVRPTVTRHSINFFSGWNREYGHIYS